MKLSDFDFELPEELIAKYPAEKRDESRLLVANRKAKEVTHHTFAELPKFLNRNDFLVLNNTKVIPARLFGKTKHGGEIEVLLLERAENQTKWKCLVRPGRKVKEGFEITFEDGIVAGITRIGDDFEIDFSKLENRDFFDWVEKMGVVPLPPYIKRESDSNDKGTYQTVFAKEKGSVAAPTAGLHFTKELLEEIRSKGIQTAEVTLHVGYGTFAPIQTEDITQHKMHFESYSADPELQSKIQETRKRGGRVIAVGTTSARTLESLPLHGPHGRTDIFIRPGYEFKNVDALVTNFHTPKSSLFVLVSAMLGVDWAKKIYRTAIAEKYRFFSYGDAMMIV